MLSLQSYGNAALKLHENGYIPIPIKPLTKRPIISDYIPNILVGFQKTNLLQ